MMLHRHFEAIKDGEKESEKNTKQESAIFPEESEEKPSRRKKKSDA